VIKVKVYPVMAQKSFRLNKDLSEATGISPQNLGKIIRGDVRALRFETLDALCKVLECQPGDLLEYVPDQKGASRKLKTA
jgi:putative transcriptional regulator